MIRFWPLVLTVVYSAVCTVTAAPASPAEQAALKDIVVAYEQAIRSGDVSKSGIRPRLAKGFTAALPSGQIVAGYADLSKAENALRTMVGRGTRYQATEVTVDPAIEVSGDLAALTGRTFNQATAQAGKSLAFTTHWSAVAKNEGGSWRLLRHQAVMDPATNPWQVPESTGPGWSWVLAAGLLGGLAGVVIGFAAARVLAARTSKPIQSTSADTATPAGARTRAWDRTDAGESGGVAPPSTPAASRSWQTPLPPATPTQPADPDADPPAPDPAPGTEAPPPAPRAGKKRAWEQ